MIDNDEDIQVQDPSQEDDMPKSATISVVEIAGKKFVSGLFWQPLTKPRAYKKEAQEIGKREGMDIVTIRRSSIMQAGFAPKGQGAIKGMYSLAAALAGKLGNSWIGVFPVGNNRYAFVAVDDGAILPGCDVIGDREDIEQRMRYFYNLISWNPNAIFVPSDFDFGGEEMDIRDLLAADNFSASEWREFRLQPLKFGLTPREMMTYGVGAFLVVAAGAGFLQYQEVQARKEREARIRAEQIRLAELERIKANTKKEKAVKALEHPWIKMPSVDDFLKGCGGAIESFPLSIGGWLFEFASCDGGKATARYKRKDTATANAFAFEARDWFEAAPVFADDYESATLTKTVKILYGGDDVLGPVAEVMPAVSSVFQSLGIQPKFVEKAVTVAKPAALPGQQPAAEEEAPPVPDWKTYAFTFDSELAPPVIFAGHPWTGMRLVKLEVKLAPDAAKLTWTISGEFYAK